MVFNRSNQSFATDTPILVVDDSEETCLINSKVLSKLGYETVITARDGQEALDIIKEPNAQIGLILSDDKMPQLNGLELHEVLRQDPTTAQIPFLLISGLSGDMPDTISQDPHAAFLGKPYPLVKLIEAIEALYQQSQDTAMPQSIKPAT